MPTFSREWMAEFEVMKKMQDERLDFDASKVCNDRCVLNYWTLHLPPWETACFDLCLKKYVETAVIANSNIARAGLMEPPKKR